MPDILTVLSAFGGIFSGCFALALYRSNSRLRTEAKRAAGEYVALLAAHDHLDAQLRVGEEMAEDAISAIDANFQTIRILTAELAELRRKAYLREGNAFKRIQPK